MMPNGDFVNENFLAQSIYFIIIHIYSCLSIAASILTFYKSFTIMTKNLARLTRDIVMMKRRKVKFGGAIVFDIPNVHSE